MEEIFDCFRSGGCGGESYYDIYTCEVRPYGCEGGSVYDIMKYGEKNGFVNEKCYPNPGICPKDHFVMNSCRKDGNIFILKWDEYCYAQNVKDIKSRIMQ